jgi:hypothetical protein
MVQNAALRWLPEDEQVLKEYQNLISQTSKPEQSLKKTNDKKLGILWILKKNELIPLLVNIGISNDTETEVESKDLKKDIEVVTGFQSQTQDGSSVKNPFLPQFKRR